MSRVTYGPDGSQIIFIDGKPYLGFDTGDTLYVVECPPNWGLKELTDATEEELNNYENFYASLRESGDMLDITSDQFYGKVAYEDRIVLIPNSLANLTTTYESVDDMTAMINSLQNLGTKADHWKDENYWNSLEDWVVENGIENLDNYWESTDHYEAIEALGLTVEQYNARTKKARNYNGWLEDVQNYEADLKDELLAIGGEVSDRVITYIAEQWASGWSESKSKRQLKKLVDSSYTLGGPIDAGLAEFAQDETIKGTTLGTQDVQDLMDTWLAPNLHTEIDIALEASNLRNIPGYRQKLIESLKAKNKTVYGMYGDDVEMGFLVNSKIKTFENLTGILLNSKDAKDYAIIDQMLRMNDYAKETELARKIGYERGSQLVQNSIVDALGQTFGKGIIPAQQFVEGR